jgi:hypothetical protein
MNFEAKENLVRKLIKSHLAITESVEWQKRPDKIKNELIIEEVRPR